MTVFIDAGHGGNSIGASYKGRLEQDDTLALAKAVKAKLEKVEGLKTVLSREGNTNPSISERCAAANALGADYFLSIHRNAFSPEKANGAESWVLSSVKEGGNTWNYGKQFVEALEKVGFRNRGVKKGAPAYADYGVNRLTNMHSCLLEVGFIDNSGDNALFDGKFDEIAEAIAKVLCSIVELEYPEEAEKSEKGNAGTIAGDADGDGKLSHDDAAKAMKMALGLEKEDKRADKDGDGRVTVKDAVEIAKAV